MDYSIRVSRSRINSTIAVSRALGDFVWKSNACDYKSQAISSQPESKEFIIPKSETGFILILA